MGKIALKVEDSMRPLFSIVINHRYSGGACIRYTRDNLRHVEEIMSLYDHEKNGPRLALVIGIAQGRLSLDQAYFPGLATVGF